MEFYILQHRLFLFRGIYKNRLEVIVQHHLHTIYCEQLLIYRSISLEVDKKIVEYVK